MDNQTLAEQRAVQERRIQQAEETRAARARAEAGPSEEDTAMLDTLLEKLRAGDSVKGGRGNRRPNARERLAKRPTPSSLIPLMPSPLTVLAENGNNDAGDLARGMLAALQSDGFGPGGEGVDPSTIPVPPMSPTKRRARIKSDPLLEEELRNLTANGGEMLMDDAEMVDMPEPGSREPSE